MSLRAVCLLLLTLSACRDRGPYSLDDVPLDVFRGDATATVLVFTRSDCPIANRYAPELSRLYDTYSGRGVAFWLVYPDGRESRRSIEMHLESFAIPFTPVRDPHHVLVARIGATISPEAAVFDESEGFIYRGRIDDRFPAYGITREPVERDLGRAIDRALGTADQGLVTTAAVGCYLVDVH